MDSVEQSLEGVTPPPRRYKRTCSARHCLLRAMIGYHPVYSLFGSEASTGSDECSSLAFVTGIFQCGIGALESSVVTSLESGTGMQMLRFEFVKACLSSTDSWIRWSCLPRKLQISCRDIARVWLRGSVYTTICYTRAPVWIQQPRSWKWWTVCWNCFDVGAVTFSYGRCGAVFAPPLVPRTHCIPSIGVVRNLWSVSFWVVIVVGSINFVLC